MINRKELELALNNPTKYSEIIIDNSTMIDAARRFPLLADQLIQKVLNDPKEFDRLIVNSYNFLNTVKQFPQHIDQLFQPVLSDPDKFKRCFNNNYYFLSIAKECPKYGDELIKRVLNDPNEFDRIIKNNDQYQHTRKQFSDIDFFKQYYNHHNARKQIIEMNKSTPRLEAYTRGAFAGALAGSYPPLPGLPTEVINHFSLFLSPKEGGRLASTNQAANNMAKEKKEEQIDVEFKAMKMKS